MTTTDSIDYALHLADSTLILAQRNAAWCGHGPVLEQDIAISNISLDLLGQARNFYQYAASLIGNGATEDSLAYLRTERQFKNHLLAELPNTDWALTVLRQCFFSAYQQVLFQQLQDLPNSQLAAIAAKSLKEVNYHFRWSSEWVIRLGDGTEESHQRTLAAMDACWPYTGELLIAAPYETNLAKQGQAVELSGISKTWHEKIAAILNTAGIPVPVNCFMQTGGKTGSHTEHLGYMLAELQYLPRTYPGVNW